MSEAGSGGHLVNLRALLLLLLCVSQLLPGASNTRNKINVANSEQGIWYRAWSPLGVFDDNFLSTFMQVFISQVCCWSLVVFNVTMIFWSDCNYVFAIILDNNGFGNVFWTESMKFFRTGIGVMVITSPCCNTYNCFTLNFIKSFICKIFPIWIFNKVFILKAGGGLWA